MCIYEKLLWFDIYDFNTEDGCDLSRDMGRFEIKSREIPEDFYNESDAMFFVCFQVEF